MVMLRRSLILLALLGMPATVLAQASTRLSTAGETRCQRVADNVARKAQAYEAVKTQQLAVLEQVHLRLVGIVGRADARGYDVTKLKVDQAELEQRTAKIQSDYQALVASLDPVNTTCASPEKLAVSVGALRTLRTDLANLRQWITLNLRDDITQLKSQVKK